MVTPAGDVNNTYRVLAKSLREIAVPLKDYRINRIKDGDPDECTRLLRHVLLHVSMEVSAQVLPPSHSPRKAVTDKKFINIVFRYLREQSKYFPALSPVQYHLKGFGEHKMCIIDAAAKHVSIYLDNGGARVPSADSSATKKGKRGKGKSGARRGRRQHSKLESEGPGECSEDLDLDASKEELQLQGLSLDDTREVSASGSASNLQQEGLQGPLSPTQMHAWQEHALQQVMEEQLQCGERERQGGTVTGAVGSDEDAQQQQGEQVDSPSTCPPVEGRHVSSTREFTAGSSSSSGSPGSRPSPVRPRTTSPLTHSPVARKSPGKEDRRGQPEPQPFLTRSSVDNELSAIVAARDDLFADSVYSCDTTLIRREEVVQLMEQVEARLRAEYTTALTLLGDRVRQLEGILYSEHEHDPGQRE